MVAEREQKVSAGTVVVNNDDHAEGIISATAIPGTELLVDFQHKLNRVHGESDIVLIPTPSSDPDDPLNWSSLRKWVSMGIVCLWAFMLGATTLSPSITYAALIPLFGASATFLNIGYAVALFNLGFFNIFLSPLVSIPLCRECSLASFWNRS